VKRLTCLDPSSTFSSSMQAWRRAARTITRGCLALSIGVAVLGLSACAGSGDGAVGSGGTGNTGSNATSNSVNTVAVGPISGFGSIIVNGIRYDDSSAIVAADDRGGLTRSDLRLGMFVEVRGTSDSTTGLGTASAISVRSELKGVVANRTASEFQLLGVTVRTDVNTVFDNASNVVDGDFVEVYGVYNSSTRTMLATRIEKKTLAEHKLRGLVSALDSVQRRFSLGSVLVDYNNAGAVAGLANGVEVQVYGATPPASGAWPVTRVSLSSAPSLSNVSRVEIEAIIAQFVSVSNFRVGGVQIDGTGAAIEGGTLAQLANGVRVEVRGDVQAGVVRASRIKIEDASGSGGSGSGGSSGSSGSVSGIEFEVKGRIESFVSTASFIVRGTRIDASGSVTIEDGTLAQLVNGACVEVKGALASTASGSVVRATRVKFDNDC